MKKLFLFIIGLWSASLSFSQSLNPVTWTFSSKKLKDSFYEIQMTATIQSGWHLYAQVQPKDAIAIPTSFNFNKNPLIDIQGKVREDGKLIRYKDAKLGVAANEYNDKVIFIQKIKLKGNAKTNITGKLEYQTCNDERCLPPKTVNISVLL